MINHRTSDENAGPRGQGMTITVIVCTFNRCESLNRALQSVACSQVPDSVAWEVLVVDNNSADRTAQVVEEVGRQWPNRFRYLFERQQGKSHALNRGIREARGDVVAFMDDDVTVEPTWLWNLTRGLHDSTFIGSGGRILPEAFSPPRWLPIEERYALAPLAVFDLGPDAAELHEPPFGTNMAFRRVAFEKYGGFRPDLGPQPGNEVRNEDTEFGRRVLGAGERLRYEGSAVVYHAVSEDRLRKKYFLTWSFDKGRADIREQGVPLDEGWLVAGVPVHLLPRLAISSLRWLFTVQPSRRFSRKRSVWALAGSIAEIHDKTVSGRAAHNSASVRSEL